MSGGTPRRRPDALGIAPVWNGLVVVRGAERSRVANLNFFWPRRLDDAFLGDSARYYSSRAFRTRRVAAMLTDAGALLLAAAVVRRGRDEAVARRIAIAGAGAFAVSGRRWRTSNCVVDNAMPRPDAGRRQRCGRMPGQGFSQAM